MIILSIETSCDETALALYDTNNGLLGHVLHSQEEQLKQHKGVIPEIAARYHIKYLQPLLLQLLNKYQLTLKDLNYIAYTKGPGLVGSLLTGVAFAKSLAFGLNIPTIGINHLEGHLLACMITENIAFPFIGLIASGGHTILLQANDLNNYYILGETLDDAAGEALDKIAKLLELTPPTGKELDTLAKLSTNPNRFKFSLPMHNTKNNKNLNFSFSGIKTAAMLQIKKNTNSLDQTTKADLAFAFQKTVMDSLINKSKLALEITNINQLVISGGVSANSYLRSQLLNNNLTKNIKIIFPKLEFCTDNAAMIAVTAALKLKKFNNIIDPNLDIEALANLRI